MTKKFGNHELDIYIILNDQEYLGILSKYIVYDKENRQSDSFDSIKDARDYIQYEYDEIGVLDCLELAEDFVERMAKKNVKKKAKKAAKLNTPADKPWPYGGYNNPWPFPTDTEVLIVENNSEDVVYEDDNVIIKIVVINKH